MSIPDRFMHEASLKLVKFKNGRAFFSSEVADDKIGLTVSLNLAVWEKLGRPIHLSTDIDVRVSDA